uniref:Fumarylacetoacetase n=1 Tax=Arcella intermedia TaxID=1963864 RepID=A0A6B2L5A7_9EUKA
MPYGVFHLKGEDAREARVGVAIGDSVLDLKVLANNGFFKDILPFNVFAEGALNSFMKLGRPTWLKVRKVLQDVLAKENPILRDNQELLKKALFPLSAITNLLPAKIGDYTDFYSSREHAENMGRIFRPDAEPLLPNWLWLPVGYHGRASSVVVSGQDIRRPNGQVKAPTAATPSFARCNKLDMELEVGMFVGPGNDLGSPISIDKAEEHIFGIVLMNDWSARDIQAWEYVPLGPFGGKNFGTTISPWVVTLEALEPFRIEGPKQEPAPLSYLQPKSPFAFDIHLEVHLATEASPAPSQITQSNFKYLYWSMAQQLVHHTITGCNMVPGDLLGSGTISGPDKQLGSLMELSWNGKNPLVLPSGEKRTFFEDGDTCIIKGWAQGNNYRIGFGDCSGKVLPANKI